MIRFRPALIAALAAAAAIWPTWPALIKIWQESADYSGMAPLIALIALVWLVRVSPPQPWGVSHVRQSAPLLALAVLGWLVAYKANIEMGKQLLAPVILWLTVATACSWRAAGVTAAPIFYLYFAIPVWEMVVPVLQWLTVRAAETALGIAGIPVRIDGILVTIPEGRFIVQEGCSGKKYFIVTLALAVVFAATAGLGRKRALAYVACAGALALLANWIRVIIIIYAGHVSNMTGYLVAREHISLGWLIFVILLVLVFVMRRFFVGPRTTGGETAPVEPARPGSARGPITAASVLCVPLLGVALAASSRTASLPSPPSLTQGAPGWTGPLPAASQWAPRFSGAAQSIRNAFESPAGARVEVFWAEYAEQRPGSELIHYSNTVLGPGWQRHSAVRADRILADGQHQQLITLQTTSPMGDEWLVDYLYVVAGATTTREWVAQLRYGVGSWVHDAPSSIIAVAALCADSRANAERALTIYWQASRGP